MHFTAGLAGWLACTAGVCEGRPFGWEPGVVDGWMGARTAVMVHFVMVHGRVGSDTLQELMYKGTRHGGDR